MVEQTRQSQARQTQAQRASVAAVQSPEQLAYRLMVDISNFERSVAKDRKWILDTYSECLLAVRDPVGRVRD